MGLLGDNIMGRAVLERLLAARSPECCPPASPCVLGSSELCRFVQLFVSSFNFLSLCQSLSQNKPVSHSPVPPPFSPGRLVNRYFEDAQLSPFLSSSSTPPSFVNRPAHSTS